MEDKMDRIKREAGGNDQIVKTLLGFPYAGTYTREELIELEGQLRYLLEQKSYGYKYIEDYLSKVGYSVNLIRFAFERLTGVNPLEFLDWTKFLNAPPSIPGISYGWGKSKDKKYDYYFVMSWVYGYTIFGQKGDLKRDEIDVFPSLSQARDACDKLVDELNYFDKVVDVDLLSPSEMPNTSDEPIIVHSDQKDEETERDVEQVKEEVDKLEETPYEELAKDQTPQEFFTSEINKEEEMTIADNIQRILDHLKSRSEHLQNFDIRVKTFKYQQKEVEEQIERTPQIGGRNMEEFFSATAIMPILLEIEDITLPTDKNRKGGLIIFSVVDGSVTTSDKFKGEDNRMYAFTEAGLSEYFSQARIEEGTSGTGLEELEQPEQPELEEEQDVKVEDTNEVGGTNVPSFH